MTRRWTVAVGGLAVANLTAGVWMSLAPSRTVELQQVAWWSGIWAHGTDPYASSNLGVDYPPWALVLLWPLSLIPAAWRPAAWIIVNLGLVAALAWRLTGVAEDARATRIRLALLLAATACVRTLAQFSLLSCALAAIGAFALSPIAGGLALGASLMKPQIGGVALIWVILRRDWTRASVAVAVPIVLAGVFLARVAIDPWTLAAEYRRVIESIYASPLHLPGHSELRPWLWRLAPSEFASMWLTVGLLLALLLPAIVAAARRTAESPDGGLELLALCGAVSLLTARHLSYDFVLLLPAVVAWRNPPFAARAHAPRWLFLGLSGLLVAAIPSWWRLAERWGAPPGLAVLTEVDRLMCLGAWAFLAYRVNAASVGLGRSSAQPTAR